MSHQILVVLGAPDPEMAAIKAAAIGAGLEVVQATSGGAPVRPESAYKADPLECHGRTVVLVECQPDLRGAGQVIVVDHHRPGDLGYGRPPSQFLPASSIGQFLLIAARLRHGGLDSADAVFIREIEYSPWQILITDRRSLVHWVEAVDQTHILVAAADHCLPAAYRGECPGVDPDRLMSWRAESRAAFQGRSVEAVLADVERAREALRSAPRITLAGVSVAQFAATVPELPEAAAREGIPFLAELVERGRRKTVLQAAPAEVVTAWMAEQKAAGLTPYGDPARGFAGVVVHD